MSKIKKEILNIVKDIYHNKFVSNLELKKDIYNFFVIKRMIMRFLKTGDINEKLLLNNIIIAINTFGIEKVNKVFKIIMNENEICVINSFLVFLNCHIDDNKQHIKTNKIIDAILEDIYQRYVLYK